MANSNLLPEDIMLLASVSKIRLTEEEAVYYTKQLNCMLEYGNILETVDVEGVKPMINPIERSIVLRDDVVMQGLTQEEALKASASSEHGHFKVPRTIEG